MKLDISKKQCLRLAEVEGDHEIGVGILAMDPVAESPIIGECDCCGKPRALSRCWLGELETFACDECQGRTDEEA